jgi:hypothetical protein
MAYLPILILSIMPFANSMNSGGELGSPYFKSTFESKNSENLPLYPTHDVTVFYIDLIASTNL